MVQRQIVIKAKNNLGIYFNKVNSSEGRPAIERRDSCLITNSLYSETTFELLRQILVDFIQKQINLHFI